MTKGPLDPIMTGLEMLEDMGRFLEGAPRRRVELAMSDLWDEAGPVGWVITITDTDPRKPIYSSEKGFPPWAMHYRGEGRAAADAWMAAVREWRADHPEGA